MGSGGIFGFGSRAQKISPLISPLIFENFFGHETGRRGPWEQLEQHRDRKLPTFHEEANFDVKSAVASYFFFLFLLFI